MAANTADASPPSSPESQSSGLPLHQSNQASHVLTNMMSEPRASGQQILVNDSHHRERSARWNNVASPVGGLCQQGNNGGEEEEEEEEEEGDGTHYDDEDAGSEQLEIVGVSDDDEDAEGTDFESSGEDVSAGPSETVETPDYVGETGAPSFSIMGSRNNVRQARDRDSRSLTSDLSDSEDDNGTAVEHVTSNDSSRSDDQIPANEDADIEDEGDTSETTALPSIEAETGDISQFRNGQYSDSDSGSNFDGQTAAQSPTSEDNHEISDSEATLSPPPDSLTPSIASDDETGPTTPIHRHKTDGSSSPLSDLPSTPTEPDSALRLIAWRTEQRAKYGPPCECKGWCTCTKYKHFTSSVYHPEVRTVGDADGHGNADADADGEGVDGKEGEVYPLPSQTHLSEAVLAAWQPARSGLRDTFGMEEGRKRRTDAVKAEEEGEEEPQAEFTWDRERPARAPLNWEGDAWDEGRVKRVKRVAAEVADGLGKSGVKMEEDAE